MGRGHRRVSVVLIVGAGPVGLSAALFLSHLGVPVRVIDENEGPTELSKALVLWRRSLLVLDPVVRWQEMVARGLVASGARMNRNGRPLATLDFAAPPSEHALPTGLLISQCTIERLMLQELAAKGVEVERRTRLESFTNDGQMVACTIAGSRGSEAFHTPYLLGCDGGHSTVRHALGLAFDGVTLGRRLLLADVDADIDVPPSGIYMDTCRHGAVALFPFGNGRYRLLCDGGPVAVDAPRREPTLEEMQHAIDLRSGLKWRLRTAHWLAEFRVNERQVANYVHGRVILAGDAAHVHSPAGGQGMNTGIQDAANLAWKLALVLEGSARPGLLETYQAERHPVAARVIRLSGRMLHMAMLRNVMARTVRDVVMSLALRVPAVQRRIAAGLAEDDVMYHGALRARGCTWSGRACSDEALVNGTNPRSAIELARNAPNTLGTLLVPTDIPDAEWPTHVGSRAIHRVPLPEARLAMTRDLSSGHGVLVRPDGMVAVRGGPRDITAWIDSVLTYEGA